MFTSLIVILNTALVGGYSVDEKILAITWAPDGKRLFWLTKTKLHTWPDGKSWSLNRQLQPYGDTSLKLSWNASGSKLLFVEKRTPSYAIFDLQRSTIASYNDETRLVWWVGDALATIKTAKGDINDSKPLSLYLKGKKRELPRRWRFSAADGNILLGKDVRSYKGPIALFRLAPSSLSLSRFRIHRSDFYTEYDGQDYLAWDKNTNTAVVGLTSDTGNLLSYGYISSPKDGRKLEANLSFLKGPLTWIRHNVLLTSHQFLEENHHGADIYRVKIYEPKRRRFHIVDEINNRWEVNSIDAQSSRRINQPKLLCAAVNPKGNRIAYVRFEHGRSQIVFKALPTGR